MVKREGLPASLGSLELELSKTKLVPGATLTGTVTVTLTEPVEAAVISVKIEGLQWVEWTKISGIKFNPADPPNTTVKHFEVEDILGELNGTLQPGVHVLPFASKLPPDLPATISLHRTVQKQPEMPRMIWFRTDYSVSAQLEAAGLSSPSLQKTCPFIVLKRAFEDRVIRPVTATHDEQIQSVLRLGRPKTCTVQMQLASDKYDITTGVIAADVAIVLPESLNFRHVHLVLYEDVNLKISNSYKEGGQQDPRAARRDTYNTKHFTSTDSNGATKTLSGRLELKIFAPKTTASGPPVALLESPLLDITHRVAVEISFMMGSRMSLSLPVTLTKDVAVGA